MKRRHLNPFAAALTVFELARVYRRFQPDIIHHVALMPIVLGYFACLITGIKRRVNAVAGLGFVFTSGTLTARFTRLVLLPLLAISLSGRRAVVLVQNTDDLATLKRLPFVAKTFHLVRGVGVDTERFSPPDSEPDMQRVVLAARMIWSKGIGDFAEMARRFRAAGNPCRFVLVGGSDDANPAAVSPGKLEEWRRSGCPEWAGHKTNMPEVFRAATLVCLPSTYGEGVPKSLIEAASCGRAIVAYDVAGCREIVQDGSNGLLVPPGDVDSLVAATEKLLKDQNLRTAMGRESRRLAVEVFAEDQVFATIVNIYRNTLDR